MRPRPEEAMDDRANGADPVDSETPETHSNDAMGWYLNEIGKHPRIGQEEVVELCKTIEAGLYARHKLESDQKLADPQLHADLQTLDQLGRQAKERLICANLRLVVSWAKRYRGTSLDLIDLVSCGNFGLIRAVEKYDYKLGYRFSTYATWWIRQQIERGVAEANYPVHIPAHKLSELKKLKRANDDYEYINAVPPSLEHLSETTGLSEEHIRSLLEIRHFLEALPSLDRPLFEDDGEDDYYRVTPSPSALNPEDIVIARESTVLFSKSLLATLNDTERKIIERRFGLASGEPESVRCTAEAVGKSADYVNQISYRALGKMRKYFETVLAEEPEFSRLKADRPKNGRRH